MVWKIGPEEAAQQSKYVSARMMNGAERRGAPAELCSVPTLAAWPLTGGWRTKKAAGMSRTHTRTPMMSCALRQSVQETSHAANGDNVSGATPTPTETSETARLRWRSNQPITDAIIGAKKLPAAMPTSSP